MKITYCRFLPSKWRPLQASLTLEEEGLLIRISAHCMDTGHRLEDRKAASRMLAVHPNKLKKLLPKLLERGEIVEDETGIYSPRAIEEHERAFGKSTRVDTLGVTQGDTLGVTGGVTPGVEDEKSQQILRAILDKIRIEERLPPTPLAGGSGGIDHLPGQMDIADILGTNDKPSVDDSVAMVDLWNRVAAPAGAKPAPAILDEKLRKKIKARIKDVGVDGVAMVINIIPKSEFLTGRTEPGEGRRPFRADIGWAMGPENFSKIVSGKYTDVADDSRAGALQRRRNIQNGRGLKYYA